MNNLNVKFDSMEQSQRELKRKLNQLEAESKILLYILEAINERRIPIKWTPLLEHTKHEVIHII